MFKINRHPKLPNFTSELLEMERYNILLVSDDMTLRNEVMETIRIHNLSYVLSNKEASITISQQSFASVIMDIRTCGENLESEIQRLTVKGTEPPLIVFVPDFQMDIASAAISYGAFDYVLLPFSSDRLLNAINKAAEAQNLINQAIFLKPQIKGLESNIELVSATKDIARSSKAVLIRGESGTGVELLARAIHFNGPRRDGAFVEVVCGALPPNLLESELFGYEKGAVAGGMVHKSGQAELADGGTLFIRNIEVLGQSAQSRLAKSMEKKQLQPLGAEMSFPWNARIIASTEMELAERVRFRLFREDLFMALSDVSIDLLPLRERPDDIPELVNYYLEKQRRFHRRGPIIFSETIMKRLSQYPWPGNMQELDKTIERYVVSGVMPHSDMPPSVDEVKGIMPAGKSARTVLRTKPLRKAARTAERDLIIEVLKDCDGNKRKAAKALKISYKTLFNKLHEYNIISKTQYE